MQASAQLWADNFSHSTAQALHISTHNLHNAFAKAEPLASNLAHNAQMSARGSAFTKALCKLCAEICNACAAECEKLSAHACCKSCAAACKKCATACASM